MIESPLLKELLEKNTQETTQILVLELVRKRFGKTSMQLSNLVKSIQKEARLRELLYWAAICPDLAAFTNRLMEE